MSQDKSPTSNTGTYKSKRAETRLSPAHQQELQDLRRQLKGNVVLPESKDYTSACEVFNAAIQLNPAIIVYCTGPEDVSKALNFAVKHDLTIAVRSGGHDISGYSSVDDGMVIDLSRMRAIAIDPERRVARLEPGLTWQEVAIATQQYNLALTSGDTGSVGVGGLLLNSGVGWMVRKYGLAIDHLRSVELVTADGQITRASVEENPDLFWGLRGGGGNFGIATAFEVDLHPAGIVVGGVVLYDAVHGEEILKAALHFAETAPEELTVTASLLQAPPLPFIPADKHGKPVIMLEVCYIGNPAEGMSVVAPLRALGTPVADIISQMPYSTLLALNEMGTIRGLRHTFRSLLLQKLTDNVILSIFEAAAATMSPETLVQIRVLGGAVSRVSPETTACAHRDKQAMVNVINSGGDPQEDEQRQARTEQFWQILQPYCAGVYPNFLGDEAEQRIHDAYPQTTYARLVELKKRYDPDNLFHRNQNILPR